MTGNPSQGTGEVPQPPDLVAEAIRAHVALRIAMFRLLTRPTDSLRETYVDMRLHQDTYQGVDPSALSPAELIDYAGPRLAERELLTSMGHVLRGEVDPGADWLTRVLAESAELPMGFTEEAA